MDLEFDFEKRYRLVREVLETLILTLLMFLVIRLAVQNFNVDGMSMEPNVHNLELVLVDKWSYHFRSPARGDVIVFVAPPDPAEDFIKRVIGLPGDIVSVDGTRVTVNGHVLTEYYIDPNRQGNQYPPFTNRIIPPNTYFVLGDNRAGSSDSRNWGCVPAANVIGQAALIYWPLGQDNYGLLPNVTSAYTAIPSSPPAGLIGTNTCPIAHPGTTAATTSTSPVQLSTVFMLFLPGVAVVTSARKRRRVASKR